MNAIAMPSTRENYVRLIENAWHDARETIGQTLLNAKASLAYGEWLDMIEHDLPFSPRQAQRLMADAEYNQRLANTTTWSHLPKSYRAREELRKLPEEKLPELIEAGTIHQNLTVRESTAVVHGVLGKPAHAPLKLVTTPAPASPRGNGAQTFSEFIWLMIQARNKRGMSQTELDARIGWTDSQTSKYEIPHKDTGRRASWDAIADWLTGLGMEIHLLPSAGEFKRDEVDPGLRSALRRV